MRIKQKSRYEQELINDTMRYLKFETRHINCIRLHKSTSKPHRAKLFEICCWLIDHNYDFITEAEFVAGGRADIICLSEQCAFEILDTETKEMFDRKKYPIPTFPIKTTDEWKGL